MRLLVTFALFLFTAALPAFAAPPTFKHIIIVVQENRTPDNLFGGNRTFEQGVDIQQGLGGAWCLGACFSPDHRHSSWEAMFNGGGPGWNNGQSACSIPIHDHCFDHNGGVTKCNGTQVNPPTNLCRPQTYVSTTYDNGVVAPYFDIAQKYGFANYFFQTNQGPSFPAHQFLFTGTSAPTGNQNDNTHKLFAAENPGNGSGSAAGCNTTGYLVSLINQNGNENTQTAPCFTHNSLTTTLLDPNGISWKYYTGKAPRGLTSIWTAPNSISDICGFNGTQCNSQDWLNDVFFNSTGILSDLGGDLVHSPCNLRNVSWVIPNGHWSDHPGMKTEVDSTEIEGGPAWVASIINTLGTSTCTDTVDGVQKPYWQDTVVFVVWDDWGGWWDHVDPESAPNLGVQNQCTGWGCGYTHGFRVPFLVVSAYMAPAPPPGPPTQGYVSGSQGEVAPYIHDFGSILAFIENNFGLGIGSINLGYPFADAFAPEQLAPNPTIPLADFFCNAPCQWQQFRPITVPSGAPQALDFIYYTGTDTDPDNDAIDND